MAVTPAIIGATAAVGSGIAGGLSAGDAADAQQQASQQAADRQLAMYTQTRNDLQPFMFNGQQAATTMGSLLGWNPDWTQYSGTPAGGGSALSGMGGGGPNSSSMLSALQNYPGYQFALGQGVQALDRSAAARGSLYSGGTLKDLTAYGQGMGSQLFDNFYSKLAGLASLGQNSAVQTGNSGTSAAGNYGSFLQSAGTAAAGGIAAQQNAINNALNSATKGYTTLYDAYGPYGSAYSSSLSPVTVTPQQWGA